MRAPRGVAALLVAVLLVPALPVRADTERVLGERFMLEARGGLPLVDDPAVTGYVQRLGARLVETLGAQQFDYQFFVVAHPALNAFAVPGGYIFVFTGLLEKAKNDDELVGVLGHEIAHVHAHHIVRQQVAGQMWSAAALAGVLLSLVNPVLGAAGIAAAQTAQLKFSREFEQEADFLGLRIASEGGYDPNALGGFFKALLVEQRLNPTGVPPYMLSHPVTEDRVAHTESVIRAQKLRTPPGRPQASPELAEVRAVAEAIDQPNEVVVPRYQRLAADRPNDAEAQFLLGRVLQTVGKPDGARVAFEKARALGMGARLDRPLGAVYVSLKEPELGRVALERHLARSPGDGWSHLELGKAYAELGDQEKAMREWQRAIRLSPDLDEAHRLIGLALGRKGDEAQGLYQLAVAAQLRGDLEQAYRFFERTEPLLDKGSAQHAEVEAALDVLEPIVRDRMRARAGRRGLGAAP
ncbi:MAG: M48 family metalloprotease [bacterium]|nr:M48 family metalloprotease [bacterium]